MTPRIVQSSDFMTDETAGLQAALAAAAGGTLVVDRIYTITSPLVPAGPTTIVFESGAGLRTAENISMIQHAGTVGAPAPVGSSVAAGTRQVTLSDVGGFTVGGHGIIRDSAGRAMLFRVAAVTGTALTFDVPLYRDFGAAPQVAPVQLAPRLRIVGGDFAHLNPNTQYKTAVHVTLADRPTFDGVQIHDCGGPAVEVSHCFGGSFTGDVWDLLDGNGHYGYGVSLGGTTRQFAVRSGTATRVRHGVTTTQGGGPDFVYGVGDPLRNRVSREFAVSECSNAGLDTHTMGWANVFEPNVSDCLIGVQDRASNTVFSGGMIAGFGKFGAHMADTSTGALIDGTVFDPRQGAVSAIRVGANGVRLRNVYAQSMPTGTTMLSGYTTKAVTV